MALLLMVVALTGCRGLPAPGAPGGHGGAAAEPAAGAAGEAAAPADGEEAADPALLTELRLRTQAACQTLEAAVGRWDAHRAALHPLFLQVGRSDADRDGALNRARTHLDQMRADLQLARAAEANLLGVARSVPARLRFEADRTYALSALLLDHLERATLEFGHAFAAWRQDDAARSGRHLEQALSHLDGSIRVQPDLRAACRDGVAALAATGDERDGPLWPAWHQRPR